MMSFAIGLYPGLNRKPTERECWCYMGFTGGPLFVDILVDDHLGRPNPNFPNLHEAAERARVFVRDYVTDWYSKRAGAATLRASRKLLGPHYGIPDEKLTPILRVAYRWLRIVYGLVPQRMSQRKMERIEATFAKNTAR
jgi:hypothetical protein